MDKRGQVYLLAALLLSFILVAVIIKLNTIQADKDQGDFLQLSENYNEESTKFINHITEEAFRNPTEYNINKVSNVFMNFTKEFTKYSKTQNPGFGIIYFFDYANDPEATATYLLIGNYLEHEMIITVGSITQELVHGCKTKIHAGASFDDFEFDTSIEDLAGCNKTIPTIVDEYDFNFIIGNIEYTANISRGESKIGLVSEELKNKQRKVHMKDFLRGKKIDIKEICAVHQWSNKVICNCAKRDERNCEFNSFCRLNEQRQCVEN